MVSWGIYFYENIIVVIIGYIFNYCYFYSVNFKKNEKIYDAEKSEVFKMLQEADNEPEPGNEKFQ